MVPIEMQATTEHASKALDGPLYFPRNMELRLKIVPIAILVAALTLPSPGRASDTVWIIGIGGISCATWLADPQSEAEGSGWILGFWSGANMAKSAEVGKSTDGAGIIERVKRACRDDPALRLTTATADLYIKFRDEGR